MDTIGCLKNVLIASVIARQTGIPIEKILSSKQHDLLHLKEKLQQKSSAKTMPC